MIQKEKILSFIAFVGFILGILYVNIVAEDYLRTTSLFNSYSLNQFQESVLILEEYLPTILWVRLAPVVLLIVIGYSSFRKVGVYCVCVWTGFLWGCYMSLCIVQLGVFGIFFCILSTIPHMLFYLPAYIIVLLFVYRQPSSRWSIEKVCAILICLVLGIILECQVNPFILKWFINVM